MFDYLTIENSYLCMQFRTLNSQTGYSDGKHKHLVVRNE